jgi:hypothetical protein
MSTSTEHAPPASTRHVRGRTMEYSKNCRYSEPFQFFTDVSVISIQFYAMMAYVDWPDYLKKKMQSYMDSAASAPGFMIRRRVISYDDEGKLNIARTGHSIWIPLKSARAYFCERMLQDLQSEKSRFDAKCRMQPDYSETWHIPLMDEEGKPVTLSRIVGGRNKMINSCEYTLTLSNYFNIMYDANPKDNPLGDEKACHSMTNKLVSQFAVHVGGDKPLANCPLTYDEMVFLLDSIDVRKFVYEQIALHNSEMLSGADYSEKRKAVEKDEVENPSKKKRT